MKQERRRENEVRSKTTGSDIKRRVTSRLKVCKKKMQGKINETHLVDQNVQNVCEQQGMGGGGGGLFFFLGGEKKKGRKGKKKKGGKEVNH